MEPGVDDTAAYLNPYGGDAWARAAHEAGGKGTQKLREATRVAAPAPWITAQLGLQQGEAVIARRRTMLLNERPVELTDSYYPLHIAAGTLLEQPGRIPGGAIAVLAGLGFDAHHADEVIDLDAIASGEEAELLAVRAGTHVIRIQRVVKNETDIPFEATEMVMLPAGRVLRHRILV